MHCFLLVLTPCFPTLKPCTSQGPVPAPESASGQDRGRLAKGAQESTAGALRGAPLAGPQEAQVHVPIGPTPSPSREEDERKSAKRN